MRITRRSCLQHIGLAIASGAILPPLHAAVPRSVRTSGLGLVIYDCNLRRRWMREQNPAFDLFEPLNFLKHCHSLGAGGMQASLGVMTAESVRQLRDFADQHDLFIDAIVRAPENDHDLTRFESEILTARDVGVQAARTTIMPGRRYEQFKTLEECRQAQQRGREMLRRAVPIVEKHRVRLAVENHKDQRIDERIALMKQVDSEFIGVCLDTGNSFALLDGAYEPIEALAPYAFTVHLKDQALQEYEKGFLLGDIPLGQGSFDLKRMVDIIRRVQPDIRFTLELITRDALRVPCLAESYWVTMPDVPGSELARTMRFVRQHRSDRLQQVSALSLEKQVELEDANIATSLFYAGQQLGL